MGSVQWGFICLSRPQPWQDAGLGTQPAVLTMTRQSARKQASPVTKWGSANSLRCVLGRRSGRRSGQGLGKVPQRAVASEDLDYIPSREELENQQIELLEERRATVKHRQTVAASAARNGSRPPVPRSCSERRRCAADMSGRDASLFRPGLSSKTEMEGAQPLTAATPQRSTPT